MTFANPLPLWLVLIILAAAAGVAYAAYARVPVPLSAGRRATLSGLRLVILLLLVVFLMRPMIIEPPIAARDGVVPVLVDVSRSMRIADVDGRPRIEVAGEILRRDVLPALGGEFQVDVLGFADGVHQVLPDQLSAHGNRSDLVRAVQSVRERYRGRPLTGIVVISDGGDTGGQDVPAVLDPDAPAVFSIGVGSPRIGRDRELVSLTAGPAAVAESVVDLSVSAASHGFGTEPIEMRVLQNGRPIQVRRVTPPAEGSPVREIFHVSPEQDGPTVYTVELAGDPSELVAENNRRSVLVPPPGRARRILMVEGAPGHEHTFLKRAWAADRGLEVDAVSRKGQNERGQDTFYVRAAADRAPALSQGFPLSREALFAYDAIVFANVEADFFTRDQLAMTADFVAARGGGLLVLGGRSFAQRSFTGTQVEEILPVDLSDRGSIVRTSASANGEPNTLVLTADGERHPIMQLGMSEQETIERWAAAPALASVAPLGGPRPGASLLAITTSAGGVVRPLVAVQRYGRGRSMVFAGEASWRWRMMLPSSDRLHETFWRQAGRWLSSDAPDPVALSASGGTTAGDTVKLEITARDASFAPVRDAAISVRVTGPGAPEPQVLRPVLEDGATGAYLTQFRAEQTGVHRVQVEARRGTNVLGTVDQWVLVGGADLELADPRMNQELLRRLAADTGGQFITEENVSALPSLLAERAPAAAEPIRRDLWHNGWTFSLLLLLLGSEWTLRRRWGLR